MEEVKDVSTIQDEDVLRRMWQTTEDFSRKKEIRAHMYKLREARLKEFYTTGEVLRDVQRSNSSPGLREQPCVKDEGPTHADSLADHSFLSLKTKEIRDSESPTREVQYRNSKNQDTDGQWTISSKTESSEDGKRITSSQLATTQGVRALDGGQLAYAAVNEHQASVYSDGDANNYTRSMGESSKTFAQENVVSGDENNFRSSKTTSSSSSSRMVTHHSSTTGDFENLAIMDKNQTDYCIPEDYTKSSTKVTKTTYTSGDIPDDLKKSIADGNTKVYTETKTMPDGSTVTTTRYETKGTKKFTSGSTSKSSKQVVESSSEINNKNIDNNSRIITTKTREIYDDSPIETETVRITKSEKRIRDNDDNARIVTTETREIYDESPKTETIKIIKTKQVYDDDYKTNVQNERIIRNDDRKVVTDTKVTRTKEDYLPESQEIHTTVTTKTISNVTENEPKYDQPDNIPIKSRPKEQPQARPQNLEVVKSYKPEESYKPNSPTDGQYSTTYRSEFTNKKISVEVSATHDAFARSLRSISPDRISERPKSRGSTRNSTSSLRSSISPDKCPKLSPERKPSYDRSPDQKRPITSPTKHEYYPERSSPERRRPDNTETITKRKPTERKSPERPIKNYSPARTPTSPTKIDVTITKTTKMNRNQTSPERPRGSSPIKPAERTSPVKDVNTDTIIRRKKVPVDDERKSPVRSPTKTTTEIISTETITKKKKIPADDNERKSPIRSPTKTTSSTEITTVNSDTITKRKNIPTDDDERKSPVRSPTKGSTTVITTVNTDTITRKKNVPEDDERQIPVRSPTKNTTFTTDVTEINTDTITRKKQISPEEPKNGTLIKKKTEVSDIESQIVTDIETTKRPTSRDLSPTSLASDIEFINHNRHIVTDLDEPCDMPEKRPTTLDITETVVTKQTKVTKDKKSPTKSPTKDKSSPVKEIPKKSKPAPDLDSPSEKPPTVFKVPDDFEQVCEVVPQESKEKPTLKRTETYEERCRQMLGLPEPDNIPKKEYDDMYAGKEPVEEPMFTKKYVAPLGPEDNLMHETVEKVKQRRPEIDEINIEEFIVTERKDVLETSKPNDKPKKVSSPERKSPQKPKDDDEYITEYTDEYIEKPIPEKRTQDKPSIKSDTKDKKPVKTLSPDRKSPQRKIPKDKEPSADEYTTEYVDEYCDKPVNIKPDTNEKKPSSPERKSPQKKSPTDTEYTTECTTKITTPTNKKSTSPDRKPEKKQSSPERKSPQKKTPTDTEYTIEYTTKITNSTDKKSTSPSRKPTKESPEKKPSSPERKFPQKKSPTDTEYTKEYTTKIINKTDRKSISPDRKPVHESPEKKTQPKKEPEDMEFSTEYIDEYCEVTDKYITTRKPAGKKTEPKTNDTIPVPVVSSPTKRKPEKVNRPKRPDDSTDEEDIDECTTTTTEVTDFNTTETIKKDFYEEYIPENLPKTNDFISREKYDTDITLTTKKSPSKLPDTEFNLETQNTNVSHVRTHRIDTTVEDSTSRETSPRRHPQKAVPSDTMECTFKRTVTEDEHVIKKIPEEPKTSKKPTKFDDRKSPVKQVIKKDSVPKTITAVKTVTKKLTTAEIEAKKVQETPKKKSPTDRIPKDKSPERIKARSPSPINKSVTKKTVVEHNVIHKTSSKDIPIKKTPEKPSKPISSTRTPSESPIRKPTTIPCPVTSPERKPQKSTTKTSPISKSAEPISKHVVTKTIALTNRPNIKLQPASPVKTIPKTITTIKTTKLTQPSSVTVTTVKTTKTTKKTIKPQKPETDSESDSEAEIIDVSDNRVDRKKVVTTAKIKINNISKQPNVTMPSIKVNTNEVITDNQPTKSDQLTTKCITTKSIVLNHAETEELEFIIDLQRSTSSREPSPDKICPIPVSSEDEGSYPRYPDQVSEPDDQPAHRRPVKVSDIPLNEEEDVKDFNRITEITETIEESSRKPYTRITDIDMVTETDESLLSVTEKVNKFITTAEKLTEDEPKAKTPAPKVPRPELYIDEHLENDECLLSVSDKVSKFITTAEHVAVKTTERSKSPRPRENTPVEYKVNENDECLLSVNQKVSHFIQAAETSKQKPATKEGPAPKVTRPEFNVDETLKTDECLLSVSDKVSKFLTTAEKLTDVKTTKNETNKRESPEKILPKSPEKRRESIDKHRQSPEKRRESPEKITKPEITFKREPSPEKRRESPEKITRSEITFKRELTPEKSPRKSLESCELPYRPKSEPKPVNLKSSEAVRKAKAMFENISKTQEVPKQRDILSRPSIWEGRKKPEKPEDEVKLTDIGVYRKPEPEIKKKLSYTSDDLNTCKKITTDLKDVALKSTKLILNESNVEKTRYLSPEKDIPGYMKPISKPTRDELPETKIYRSKSPNPNGDIPGYMKPISKQTPDEPDRPISRSRSPNPIGEIPGYMKPIPKVSAEERDKYILETRLRETYSPEKILHYENGDETPHYMLPLQRNQSPERDTHYSTKITKETEIIETVTEKSNTPERDIPGYMKPLQRHAHSPDREERKNVDDDDSPRAAKKFGVTLRRTDSGRMITTTSSVTERRRSSTPGQPNIEEIQDLEVLEKMMDKVVGYEQRRRIRAQIRIVKKLISDNKVQKRITKVAPSPTRDSPVTKISPQCEDRKSPIRDAKRAVSPAKKSPETRQKSPDPKRRPSVEKSSFSTVTSTTTQKSERVTSTKERSLSPEPKKRTTQTSQMYKTDLKHVQPTNKIVQDDKPSWVTNRNLKKTSETVTEKKVVSLVKKPEPKRSPSPQKDEKPIDCITSSYGIGPTDENGQPLFGIKALRKAADHKVHIRGTVMSSQFYSENGEEPIGEVTVTKYSNDPKELNIDDEQINKSKGIASITTTQKFGSRGSPTLSSLVDKKKAITDQTEDELFKTTSTKVTRRGSVKALSQKFIENAVETSRNEKQTYPKAGLILRTSSFKETNQTTDRNSSRDSSPGKVSLDSVTSDSRQQTIQDTSSTKTFLNSHTRVANAQEVITRMKNSEKEHIEGDSPEDREARMLLNKFLGAQVLMSGMEPLISSQTMSTTSTSSSQLVRKVQKKTVTSTTKETSKPLSLTKRYQTPITAEVLQDIWDEQTLRALLEQCTDYEERRAIRARLRQVMAEQEAVANVVASAVAEGDRTMQERIETTKKTFSEGPVTTTQVSTRVVQQSKQVSKPISPFAKFRQLDKQNSLNTPPSSPRTPTGTGAPLFKFTDPALSHSASTVKDRLLHWCQMKTKEYQNIKLENFSTSWADGMAFCALIHHFLPDTFDYHALNPKQRRHNFTLAFKVADEQAGIAPLLDVDDMVAMRRPDWKCVFTYVQSIYRRFKDEDK